MRYLGEDPLRAEEWTRTDRADVYVDSDSGHIQFQTLREHAQKDFTKQVLPHWGRKMDYRAIAPDGQQDPDADYQPNSILDTSKATVTIHGANPACSRVTPESGDRWLCDHCGN